MPSVVQFPHPGMEHRPSPPSVGTVMPWNRDEHRRKFLCSPARYLDGAGQREGDVALWGEWEAQSRVLEAWAKEASRPRFPHAPFCDPLPDGGWSTRTSTRSSSATRSCTRTASS